MEPPAPLVASSPRSPLPAQSLHAQATGAPTGAPPPPPLPASSPCLLPATQTPLYGQATAAPTETRPPAAPAPLPPPARPRPPRPYTAELIFRDYACRRAALIRALTTDEKVFSRECNTGPESLCLYGNGDGSWELRTRKLLKPPGQPDPRMLGVKLVRGDMKRSKWLRHIAMHCDAWLIRISFFLGANLGTRARQRLSAMINSLQTVHETFVASETYHRICHLERTNEENEDEDECCGSEPTICASCGVRYRRNGFWICCDVCERWFHGKCVKITAAQAEHIDQYECPECWSDRKGHDYNVDPTLSVLFKRC